MQYLTLNNLVAETSLPILQQLAPWVSGQDEASGEYATKLVSNTLVDSIEETALGELHGYLRGIYSVPLADPVEPLLRQTIAELMHYQLYKQRDGANLPDKILELYKGTVKRMQAMQRREIVLDAAKDVVDNDRPQTFQFISPPAKFPANFTSARNRLGGGF
ncbi:MAG: phage protein Gp36 family protein [Chlorobiaceae bacterium]